MHTRNQRPLLWTTKPVTLTLATGERVKGVPNYTSPTGIEVYVPSTGKFRWLERAQIVGQPTKGDT